MDNAEIQDIIKRLNSWKLDDDTDETDSEWFRDLAQHICYGWENRWLIAKWDELQTILYQIFYSIYNNTKM